MIRAVETNLSTEIEDKIKMETQLCKAKTFDGEWICGYYVKGLDMYDKEIHVIFDPTTVFYSHGETDGFEEIDPSTLCRCTGSHDKNGKLIFENDILNGKLYNVVSYGNGENKFLGMNVGWYVQRDNFESWCELNDLEMYEVTGNIFEENI